MLVSRRHTWLSVAAGARLPVIVAIQRLIRQIVSGLLFKPGIKVRDAAGRQGATLYQPWNGAKGKAGGRACDYFGE